MSKICDSIGRSEGCVSQVRKWLDNGASKSEIAITMQDPEEYWPVLSAYLDKEGIGVAKGTVCVAHSLPSVSKWLSEMRTHCQPLSSEDYEARLFSQMSQPELSYEKFRSVMSQIYSEEDLLRFNDLKIKIDGNVSPHKKLSRDEFVIWCLKFWDLQSPSESIQKIMSPLLLESPSFMKMSLVNWFNYLQTVASKTEINISEPDHEGVQIRKMNSLYVSKNKYTFFMGHSDKALDESLNIHISLSDASRISQDLGFLLDRPEPGKGLFLTDWSLESKQEQIILSFSQSDFSGSALGASLSWLKYAEQLEYGESLEHSFQCRWG